MLAWHLGSPAGPQELDYFRRWAELVREHDPLATRPIVVTPRGDWLPCSRLADVLLADHPVGSNLSEPDFAEWLQGLPLLARPGTPFWASHSHAARRARSSTIGGSVTRCVIVVRDIDERQLEALVTAAATSGCRGFLFRSDSPLDASDEVSKRRAVLLEIVNNRLDLIGPWLTVGKRVGEATSTDSTATAICAASRTGPIARSDVAGCRRAGSQHIPCRVAGIHEHRVSSCPAFRNRTRRSCCRRPACGRSPSKRVAGGTRIVLDRNDGAATTAWC